MRVLFVCRQNRCRSRVAEDIFRVLTWDVEGRSPHDARSAGTNAHPRGRQITTEDVEWADVICVMEQEQEGYIRKRWHAQGDKIDLDQSIFKALATGAFGSPLAVSDFYASSNGAAHAAGDHILYNTTTGALSYDTDGTGAAAAVQIAVILNHPTLQANDFLLV